MQFVKMFGLSNISLVFVYNIYTQTLDCLYSYIYLLSLMQHMCITSVEASSEDQIHCRFELGMLCKARCAESGIGKQFKFWTSLLCSLLHKCHWERHECFSSPQIWVKK